MTKRTSGEGGFFHDAERGIWIYQIRYTDATGKRGRKKFAAKTKKEAMQKGREFLENIRQGMLADHERMTVGNWIDRWLTEYVQPHVRPRTWEKYRSCLDRYIVPFYGAMPLRELNASDLQAHFNRIRTHGRADGTGLSASTVRATRRYLCMSLDDAVKAGLLLNNPVRNTKPAKLVKKENVVLDKEQVSNMIQAATEMDSPVMCHVMPVLLALTAHTGMRQGEVFGLKWEDVDFNHGCIFIRRSLAHVIGKGAVFQEPKTKNSRRRILLLKEDVDMLRYYQEWQRQYAEGLGDKYAMPELVFASPFGTPISPTNFTRRYFRPLLQKCGIDERFTFHGLRHTHATLLLQQGVNPKIVQERLGHSSIKVTMDTYSHVLPDMQRQAVDAMEKIFE